RREARAGPLTSGHTLNGKSWAASVRTAERASEPGRTTHEAGPDDGHDWPWLRRRVLPTDDVPRARREEAHSAAAPSAHPPPPSAASPPRDATTQQIPTSSPHSYATPTATRIISKANGSTPIIYAFPGRTSEPTVHPPYPTAPRTMRVIVPRHPCRFDPNPRPRRRANFCALPFRSSSRDYTPPHVTISAASSIPEPCPPSTALKVGALAALSD
ncbi:hypothetical protein K488DRAFT_72320, partial [Vararia minispora EC-137]